MLYWIIISIFALVLGIFVGYLVTIKRTASRMLKDMHFGTIIIDMKSTSSDTISCEFDRNPREFLGMDYILMDVKIRK